MAIYHCSIKNIGRGGKSAVAAAAYRAGKELYDQEAGQTFDYTKKPVAYSEIILCQSAPEEYRDRETLWNAVQNAEKASDARFAREFEVAIPHELDMDQSIALARSFAETLAAEGMCVDFAIHNNKGNRHAHVLATTRPINEDGSWGAKEKKVYKLDENGERIPLLDADGNQKVDGRNRKQWARETVETTGWNKKEKLQEWRERWADCCNTALLFAGYDQRVDHRSNRDRGIEDIPTVHEGWYARKMERMGGVSDLCQRNRNIKRYNLIIHEERETKKSAIRDFLDFLFEITNPVPKDELIWVQDAQRIPRSHAHTILGMWFELMFEVICGILNIATMSLKYDHKDGSRVTASNGWKQWTFTLNEYCDVLEVKENGDKCVIATSNLQHSIDRIGEQMPTSWTMVDGIKLEEVQKQQPQRPVVRPRGPKL